MKSDILWKSIKMDLESRKTDAKGRVSSPRSFANATVIIEEINDMEIRIRKAVVMPEADARFLEES